MSDKLPNPSEPKFSHLKNRVIIIPLSSVVAGLIKLDSPGEGFRTEPNS